MPFLAKKDTIETLEAAACSIPAPAVPHKESWLQALWMICKDYVEGFIYIVVRTVPLMFVAGFLGALVSHVWDPGTLIGTQPSFLVVLLFGIFGTFLPMPIAFDVMAAQSLFAANVPIVIVMTLLFTLGTFSIYSFFIVWRTFSLQLANLLFAIIVLLGVIAGYLAQAYADYRHSHREQQYSDTVLSGVTGRSESSTGGATTTQGSLKLNGLQSTRVLPAERLWQKENFSIDSIAFEPAKAHGSLPFIKMYASDLGISTSNEIDARNFIEPFFLGRGLASGDMNNDGWVDFYVTIFGHGNFLITNHLSPSTNARVIRVSNGEALLTTSMSIGDINNDGWLDILHGNWNGGELTANPGDKGRNDLLLNRELEFTAVDLPRFPNEVEGNTLTALLSDINHDNQLDILLGNDFEVPDRFYINQGNVKFAQISKQLEVIPGSPLFNMSIDTADYDNDLKLDIYMTGGSWAPTHEQDRAAARFRDSQYCATSIANESRRKKCEQIWSLSKIALVKDFKECSELLTEYGEDFMRDCLVAQRVHTAKWDREACSKVPETYTIYRTLCNAIEGYPERTMLNIHGFIEQLSVTNVMLKNLGSDGFENVAEATGTNFGA